MRNKFLAARGDFLQKSKLSRRSIIIGLCVLLIALTTTLTVSVASAQLKNQRIPDVVKLQEHITGDINNILIYNHYRNINHSLILFSKA